MTESYILKVSLGRGMWRRIQIPADATLHKLHQAIQNGFGLDDDHLYAFFMDNKAWSRLGDSYWSPGNERGPFAHKVRLCQLNLIPKQKFLYLFDFGDEWKFTVTFEKSTEEKVATAKVIAGKGEALEQYTDWEEE